MSDIMDYVFFYLTSAFLMVLKVAGFINWDWWVTGLPAALGVTIHIVVTIAR
ncbi:MAG: hypothetical protein K2Q01_09300 [Rickettsiales bacterium]|nr:hypothetical protein [Rickettsiales bacterium]